MNTDNKKGTANELLVAFDLTKKGYEVFHSFDGKTSCDFIILKNGCSKRVEVKTRTSPLNPTSKEIITKRKKSDILAIVVNMTIYYYPELKEPQDEEPI